MKPLRLFRRGKVYYIGYEGNERSSLGTSNEKVARQLFKDAKKKWKDSKVTSIEKMRRIYFADFMKEYLAQREIEDLSEKTFKLDQYALKTMKEAIGNLPLRIIKRDTVEDFKAFCRKKKLQMSSINIMMRHLKTAFNHAYRKKYIDRNPFVKEHQHDKVFYDLGDNLPRFFKLKELKLLISEINDPRDYLIINMYFYTGMRRAELLNLKITDIDLDDGGDGNDGGGEEGNAVYITNQTRRTKTRKERAVPINEYLKPMLSYYLRKCDGSACVDILQSVEASLDEYQSFCLKEFTRIRPLKQAHDIGPLFPWWSHPDTITHRYQIYRDKAGLDKRLYDLRHTFGSFLSMAGTDIVKIKELMGHANIKTTEIYAKVNLKSLRGDVNKLKMPEGGK